MEFTSNTKMLQEIIKYLDFTSQLHDLLGLIQSYKQKLNSEQDNFFPLLYHCIEVDFPLLIDIAGNAANFLLVEPDLGQQLFQQVIDLAIKTEDPRLSQMVNQIQLTLRISLPLMPSILSFDSQSSFANKSGLSVIKGIVMARTIISKYCKSAVFRCPTEGCCGHKGHRVFDSHSAASICSYCGCTNEEFLRARINGDQALAVFVNPSGFQQNNFLRHQGITVSFKDELTRDLELGVCYNVVVSFKPHHMVAWGIERTISEHQWRFTNGLPTVAIPLAILQHLQKTDLDSPWNLTATLSSQLASHIYPLNSFFQLKIGLLLSLASQDLDKMPVHLLAVGPDCCQLLQSVSQLSRRHVGVTSPTLSGAMGGSMGAVWMEAGPLLLASGGVCYIGDWAKFGSGRSSVASQIVTAIESGQVDLVDSSNTVLGSPASLPLRAAVWTFWSGDKATSAAQTQLRTLIEIFGMPFIGDGSGDIEAVAQHLLLEAMQSDVKPPSCMISPEDLKQYLDIVCSFKVQLTPEASKLLRNYFVASRRERPDCLPLTAIKTMTSLAEAHARLCLRTHVISEDVILVICLYEEAITALYGPSLMSPPPTVFASLSAENGTCIGQQVDLKLKNFSMWLQQYIKSLLSESSVNLSVCEE
ncbi:minichromosome maintenance domain-containing protein 2 [Homalodisca vitripennis]|uniref:minichromosome maintenance domain-containing protein 2 n=1 Tax=Homalodisca vitripennis TaxID=197043 RepID=UPI001EEC7B28|nr:minichromosome maintenance domain-containing protein 2 [Homalodisca vitripennis]XP_046673021.1 minichromosome maintenance domain-containing protein 2 [Homalodisca vitripennis]XP_046673022.1 minichromosome maintenance domain-containing protein 2 [Homalodisca vitripennis]XP_046673023.1 minichromosome maintenance domain-containing protein 2 [Homalodisca vitripennis]